MKLSIHFLQFSLFFFLFSFISLDANSQNRRDYSIPSVDVEQSWTTRSLPYGRKFYLKGNPKSPDGWRADKIEVKLYKTGETFVTQNNKSNKVIKVRSSINNYKTPANLLENLTWYKTLDTDTSQYEILITTPLQFKSVYLIEIEMHGQAVVQIDNNVKQLVLTNVLNGIQSEIDAINDKADIEITFGDIYNRLETELKTQLQAISRIDATSIEINKNQISDQPKILAQIVLANNVLKEKQSTFEAAKTAGKVLGDPLYDDALADVNKAQASTVEYWEVANQQLADIYALTKVYTLSLYQSAEPEVTELESILVGSTFGGGVAALNFNKENGNGRFKSADYNLFAYSALKFYLGPNDKRIKDPYLNGVRSRFSILLGVVMTGKLNYDGQELERAIGIDPIIGISGDINRFISLDLGIIVTKQPTLNESLFANSKLRTAPFLGVSFDMDLFNRFSSLLSRETYNIAKKEITQ